MAGCHQANGEDTVHGLIIHETKRAGCITRKVPVSNKTKHSIAGQSNTSPEQRTDYFWRSPYARFHFPWFQFHGQPTSENMKCGIQKINNSNVLNCVLFWVAWWNLVPSHSVPLRGASSLSLASPWWILQLPLSTLVAFLVIKSTVEISQCLLQVNLILLNNSC